MAGLMKYRITASTLLETLISLVLLISIFGIGMLVLSNLSTNTKKKIDRESRMQMLRLKWEYIQSKGDIPREYSKENQKFEIEEEVPSNFPDRRKISIFRFSQQEEIPKDSLIFLINSDFVE